MYMRLYSKTLKLTLSGPLLIKDYYYYCESGVSGPCGHAGGLLTLRKSVQWRLEGKNMRAPCRDGEGGVGGGCGFAARFLFACFLPFILWHLYSVLGSLSLSGMEHWLPLFRPLLLAVC